jgi:hypothetical protein
MHLRCASGRRDPGTTIRKENHAEVPFSDDLGRCSERRWRRFRTKRRWSWSGRGGQYERDDGRYRRVADTRRRLALRLAQRESQYRCIRQQLDAAAQRRQHGLSAQCCQRLDLWQHSRAGSIDDDGSRRKPGDAGRSLLSRLARGKTKAPPLERRGFFTRATPLDARRQPALGSELL